MAKDEKVEISDDGKSLWRKASLLLSNKRMYSGESQEFTQNEYGTKLCDGLGCTLKASITKLKGSYLQKTGQGNYKLGFIILKNAELYIYNHVDQMKLE